MLELAVTVVKEEGLITLMPPNDVEKIDRNLLVSPHEGEPVL